MKTVILENKWRNSRGEIDGWSFILDENTIQWSYNALFDAKEHLHSSGQASFELGSFKQLIIEYRQNKIAKLEGIDSGSVSLKLTPEDKVEITIRAAYGGDGCISIIDAAKLDGLFL